MSDFGRREQELALALASGRNIRDAAQHAGLSERTAHRRLQDPTFCGLVRSLRSEMFAVAVGRLAAAAGNAAGTLVELAEGAAGEGVRLASAKAILEMGNRARETEEFEQRLSEMEARLCTRNSSNG